MEIPDHAASNFLLWAYDFSEVLPEEKQVEMRMNVLRLVAQGLPAAEPPFDVEAVAEGKAEKDEQVSLATLIQAFRFYSDTKNPRGATTAQILWHMVGNLRIATLN